MAKRGRKKKIAKQADNSNSIKVRLDKRTIITVKNLSIFQIWKERFPNAEIVA